MQTIDRFTADVCRKLGYYVYRLIDPRDGSTFYVGKGKNNRVFAHAKGALKNFEGENYAAGDPEGNAEDEGSLKIRTIREIELAGLEALHVIHRHGMDEPTALEVEAALIDAYPEAVNDQAGQGSGDRGPMNAAQIQKLYSGGTVAAFADDCLLIKVRASTVENLGIDRAASYCWTVGQKRLDDMNGRTDAGRPYYSQST